MKSMQVEPKLRSHESGVVLLLLMVVLASALATFVAYGFITESDLATTRSFKETTSAFYAAEGGLNWRINRIREIVESRLLEGNPPQNGQLCSGSQDFACETYVLDEKYQATVSVQPSTTAPSQVTIPAGEPYEGRTALQVQYTVISDAQKNGAQQQDLPEARLTIVSRVRQVPIFQFAVFFDKDLEFYPGPTMEVSGPVHTNGDLYLSAIDSLTFWQPISVAGRMFRGLKFDGSVDYGGNVSIAVPTAVNPNNLVGFFNGVSSLRELSPTRALSDFSTRVRLGLPRVLLPNPSSFAPRQGGLYWDRADIRLVLNLPNPIDPTIWRAEIWGDSAVDSVRTADLQANCASTAKRTTFNDRREGGQIELLDVNLIDFLACAQNQGLFEGARSLDDSTDGGLVVYLSVFGARSGQAQSMYGVRVSNAANLSSIAGRSLRGMTLVSDQPLFAKGDVNSSSPSIPMALMGDTINVLSNNVVDLCLGVPDSTCGVAADTTIRAAIIAGSDTTGDVEGTSGQSPPESGGLHNFIRFHEDWRRSGGAASEAALRYDGSLVSLARPLHASGRFQNPGGPGAVYTAPRRIWRYDTSFNDPGRLPPLTPRFTYIQQELFSRELE